MPHKLDESLYVVKEESFSQGGQKMRITIDEIDWLVLDAKDGKVLLLSEKVLEQRPYNIEEKGITWEQCTLRKYLNNEFYNNLGTAKVAIATTNNQNNNNLWSSTNGGNITQDKVFLLSLEEVDYYFGDSSDYISKRRKHWNGNSRGDGWCVFNSHNSSRVAKDMNNKSCGWWLRSPGDGLLVATYVVNEGYVAVGGNRVHKSDGGVRPAIWLNLD
jgi:hypothetical protein